MDTDVQLNAMYAEWDKKDAFCNKTCPPKYYGAQNNEFAIDPFEVTKSSKVNLFWLVFWFHLLSFLFQIGVAINYDNVCCCKCCNDNVCCCKCCNPKYVDTILDTGVNSCRFIEYSISATLMMIALSIASGILEENIILSIGILTFTTQILGLISERLFADTWFILNEKKFVIKQNEKKFVNSARCLGWLAHFLGWVTMLTAYIVILITHFNRSNKVSDVHAPDFVYAAVWSVCVFYNLFGVTQICQLCLKDFKIRTCRTSEEVGKSGQQDCPCGGCNDVSINEWVEGFYVTLSLASKTVLGTLILTNLLSDNSGYSGNLKSC